MKLRNKKTGEIVEAYKDEPIDLFIYLGTDEEGDELNRKTYCSIAELNAEWEDYKPAEPLIKDEKIRDLVREWIKLWETEDRWLVRDNSGEIVIARGDIELYLPLSYGIKDGYYTIAELCGEEE